MSRAFVKEQDDVPEDLPERPVSSNPNFVTARGLNLIEAEVDACRKLLAQGQHDQDKAAISRASRDLRYWTLRRSSAQLVASAGKPETVGFGTRVTIQREDGRSQVFAIVGEDEADPAKGLISYTAPPGTRPNGQGNGRQCRGSGRRGGDHEGRSFGGLTPSPHLYRPAKAGVTASGGQSSAPRSPAWPRRETGGAGPGAALQYRFTMSISSNNKEYIPSIGHAESQVKNSASSTPARRERRGPRRSRGR